MPTELIEIPTNDSWRTELQVWSANFDRQCKSQTRELILLGITHFMKGNGILENGIRRCYEIGGLDVTIKAIKNFSELNTQLLNDILGEQLTKAIINY